MRHAFNWVQWSEERKVLDVGLLSLKIQQKKKQKQTNKQTMKCNSINNNEAAETTTQHKQHSLDVAVATISIMQEIMKFDLLFLIMPVPIFLKYIEVFSEFFSKPWPDLHFSMKTRVYTLFASISV